MFVPFIIALFVVKTEACSKHTIVLSLICAVKVLSYLVDFHSAMIHPLLLALLQSISLID